MFLLLLIDIVLKKGECNEPNIHYKGNIFDHIFIIIN